MGNIETKIESNSMFWPMRDCLSLMQMPPGEFLDLIARKDPAVQEVLAVLAARGAYDVLIPLNELMRSVLVKPFRRWWADSVSRLPDGALLAGIAERFHDRITALLGAKNWDTMLWLPLSPAQIIAVVWDSYPPALRKNRACWGGRELCLLPGLFARYLDADYLDGLGESLIPVLLRASHAPEPRSLGEKMDRALTRYAVLRCGSELGMIYHKAIEFMSRQVMSLPWDQMSDLTDAEYARHLRECLAETRSACGLEPEWIRRMEELCGLVEQIGVAHYFTRSIWRCLPVLLQCVGRSADACDRLTGILRAGGADMGADPVVLMGIYRALAVDPGPHSLRLYGQMRTAISEMTCSGSSALQVFCQMCENELGSCC